MDIQSLLDKLTQNEPIQFADTMAVIERHFHYNPTAFANGLGNERVFNDAGANEGSCKIFAFARLLGLDEKQTLALFGEHYQHVLDHPEGSDHQNIRQFMRHGWAGIEFAGQPLTSRQ